jgi:hypothetical protein
MARKFLTPIDLNRLELQNAVVQNLATDPESAVDGQIYYNTASDRLRVYANGSWSDVGAVTSVSGTANEISVSASTGSITIGLAENLITPGDLTVTGNLTVSGSTTYINTETIQLADNIIVLNSNATGSASENAGIEIERGDDANVSVRWNESSNKWEFTNDGSTYAEIASASVVSSIDSRLTTAESDINSLESQVSALASASAGFTNKAAVNIGNEAATSFAIDHNLGTSDVLVQVYDNATFDTVEVDVVRTTSNRVTVSFAAAPGNNAYRVVIIG